MAEAEIAAAAASPEAGARVEYELQLYYWMKLIRAFEERVSRLHRQNKILGGVYSGAGQEAIVTGICAPLHDGDFVAPLHRDHGRLHHARRRSGPPDGAVDGQGDMVFRAARIRFCTAAIWSTAFSDRPRCLVRRCRSRSARRSNSK